ncbi:MAG: PAS domain S-box protein [Luteitalea sp.]|nr:PAS domain S-box protein [Luteitalea sp.]
MDSDDRLDLFFSQSLDGFFFMMLDEPVRWDSTVDKDAVLDFVFEHQRVTKVNDAMLAQYGAAREEFVGLTPKDFFRHNLAHGRRVWRELLDRGRLHIETDERRVDGTGIKIEGDYLCFYDSVGRITGHFGIQRDVTERKRAEEALHRYNRRLQVLHDTHLGILGSRSPRGIAEATISHIRDLIPGCHASIAAFNGSRETGSVIASHDELPADLTAGKDRASDVVARQDVQPGGAGSADDHQAGAAAVETSDEETGGPVINTPLVADGELIGMLNIGAAADRAFTADEAEIAQELANTLAVAIRQAQLRERVERHAAELEDRVAARTSELERSENRLSAIVTALPDRVFVIDQDGAYVEILTSKGQLLHRDAEGLKGNRFQDRLPTDIAEMFLRVVRQTLETRTTRLLEYSLQTPAGPRWFEGRTGVLDVRIEDKLCIVFISRDITDRKRAEVLESQNIYLQEELKTERNFGEIVGTTASMRRVFKSVEMVAETDSTVLILGETGTGKELVARAIHNLSRRRRGVMVKVNCGALPASLAESELFGHERGAFTGAVQRKKGRFELADHGTIFLDEVGELSAEVQVKLLRVLQEQELERIGSTETTKVNVRVIAATNRDLHEEVRRGAFRADLYYRLNIFPIQVPSLRERKADVAQLASHFAREFARRIGKPIEQIEAQALERLTGYDWPGNVRELANVLERAVILCQGRVILEEHLGILHHGQPAPAAFPTLEDMERQHIMRALEHTGGVLAGPQGAARLLGMSRSTVWSRMRKLGIQPPGETDRSAPRA